MFNVYYLHPDSDPELVNTAVTLDGARHYVESQGLLVEEDAEQLVGVNPETGDDVLLVIRVEAGADGKRWTVPLR